MKNHSVCALFSPSSDAGYEQQYIQRGPFFIWILRNHKQQQQQQQNHHGGGAKLKVFSVALPCSL
jgi:hypothetical protein